MRFSLSQRTLQCALTLVGDSTVLARRLRVPLEDLHAWLAGTDVPPRAVFFAAVDILCAADDPVCSVSSDKSLTRAVT